MFHTAGFVDSGTSHYFWLFIIIIIFKMRRESKPCAGKGLHFYLSLWNKQGRVQFSAHSNPEKAQFFSSSRRPWIISKNVTLCISAFVCCSAKPSDHISVSNWHHRFRTLFISRWTTCLLFIFQMANSQEPLPPQPQVMICLQSLQADRVRAPGH